MMNHYVAIDPLALLLPSAVYVRLVEKYHPHEPSILHLAEVVKNITPEERAFTQARVRALTEYAGAVGKAVGYNAAVGT